MPITLPSLSTTCARDLRAHGGTAAEDSLVHARSPPCRAIGSMLIMVQTTMGNGMRKTPMQPQPRYPARTLGAASLRCRRLTTFLARQSSGTHRVCQKTYDSRCRLPRADAPKYCARHCTAYRSVSVNGPDFQLHALALLKAADDLKRVARLRITPNAPRKCNLLVNTQCGQRTLHGPVGDAHPSPWRCRWSPLDVMEFLARS